MEQNKEQQQANAPIADKDKPFLEKVQRQANLPDIYDARDLTVIVYRTMRDLMTTEASKQVESELKTPAEVTKNKRLQLDISELWRDTNPLVAWLSNLRPPLKFDDETFIARIGREGGVPRSSSAEQVIKAVFSATKAELSSEKVTEIGECLPGKIKTFWQEA